MTISHVIFDFDGVLIDSEEISMVIDRAAGRKRRALVGRRNAPAFRRQDL